MALSLVIYVYNKSVKCMVIIINIIIIYYYNNILYGNAMQVENV